MTPGTFNRKRFAALCRLDWAEKRKSYLLFLLIFYVVTAIIITYNSLHIYYDMSLIGDRIATTVPLSLVAFALVYLAADYTRILVCRTAFPAPEPLAIPLYKGIGWYFDSETRLIFQMLFTITLLGQAVVALTTTLKTAYARIFARFILVALPFILGYSFSSLIRVFPTAMDIARLWLTAWHIFFLGLAAVCWYATCRRLPRMDLEYSYPPKFDKA